MKERKRKIDKSAEAFYETAYTVDTQEIEDPAERITEAFGGISRCLTKVITSGDVREIEIYPIWETSKERARAAKRAESSTAQKNLNEKNARKKFIRLINTNFTKEDIWATFTFDDFHLPKSIDGVLRATSNYIRRVIRYMKKTGDPRTLKFAYVIEFSDDPKDGIRAHVHIIMNFRDRDAAEHIWNCGGITQARRLQPNKLSFLTGLSTYLCKDPKGKKRFVTSKNLTKPTVEKFNWEISRAKAKRLAMNFAELEDFVAKNRHLQGYTLQETPKTYLSDFVNGAYIYIKAKKMEERQDQRKRKTA